MKMSDKIYINKEEEEEEMKHIYISHVILGMIL
jgi:hypothetical protein